MSESGKPQGELERAAVSAGRNVGRRLLTLVESLGILPSWRTLARAARTTLAAAVILGLGAWWYEHDARVRQAADLKRLRSEAAADVRALSAQAASSIREANARAAAVRDLEARRRKAELEGNALRERLTSLRQKESQEVERVAALPTSEVGIRVAARLGVEDGSRESGVGSSTNPTPDSLLPTPVFSDAALRKIETALIELDSCRAEGAVRDQQAANCHEQVDTTRYIISEQTASIDKLNQALAAKDQILARREAEHRAELKAARGSLFARVARTLKYVAVGVVIGTVIR